MKLIDFTKMSASGNDFVIVKDRLRSKILHPQILAKKICHRKYGVGADGLLLLGKSKLADIKMRIFNPDGSEAQMCGNGARCTALYLAKRNVNIETKAGIIISKINGNKVKIRLTNPKDIKLDIPIKFGSRNLKVNFINTGVPHIVIFVEGLDKIDAVDIGRFLRFHKKFAPKGTNVNFIEVLGKNSFEIRTYERGVEYETLACGTGSVASALILALKTNVGNKIKVHTKGGEILTVYFAYSGDKFSNVWLEGEARIVFKGKFGY